MNANLVLTRTKEFKREHYPQIMTTIFKMKMSVKLVLINALHMLNV